MYSMNDFLSQASPELLREIAQKKEERKNNVAPVVESNRFGRMLCDKQIQQLDARGELLGYAWLNKNQ